MRALLATLALLPALGAQEPPTFETDVLPVFASRCFKCHRGIDERGRKRKPKGGLRLDGRAWIARGGDGGPVVVPGRPDESPLYILTTLDPDDDDRMPGRGDPLTHSQQDTLKAWIQAGAEFGSWTGAAGPERVTAVAAGREATVPARLALWARLGAGLQPAPDALLERLRARGAQIVPVATGSSLLRVAFRSAEDRTDDDAVAALAPLAGNIAVLDLARTRIGDRALVTVGRMQRLTRLDLSNTAVDGSGLLALLGLTQVRSISLVGTAVGDREILVLAGMPALESLYLWKSTVTAAGRQALARPGLRVLGAPELPAPAPDEGSGRRR